MILTENETLILHPDSSKTTQGKAAKLGITKKSITTSLRANANASKG